VFGQHRQLFSVTLSLGTGIRSIIVFKYLKTISRKFRCTGNQPSFTIFYIFFKRVSFVAGPAAVAGQQQTQRTRQQFFRTRPQDSFVSEGGRAIISCVIGNLGGRVQWTKDGLTMGNISIPAISPPPPPPLQLSYLPRCIAACWESGWVGGWLGTWMVSGHHGIEHSI
jgi:hypothetical protein